MKTRVQKWGNSLALRIPKSFAADAGLREDSPVELSLFGDKLILIVQAASPAPLTLKELLRGVTYKNIHREWETGPAIGKEVW